MSDLRRDLIVCVCRGFLDWGLGALCRFVWSTAHAHASVHKKTNQTQTERQRLLAAAKAAAEVSFTGVDRMGWDGWRPYMYIRAHTLSHMI